MLAFAVGGPSSAAAQSVISVSPDVTIPLGPGDLVTADEDVAVDNQLGVIVLQDLPIPERADVVAYAEGPGTRRLLALDTTVSLLDAGGSSFLARPGDVVARTEQLGTNGVYSMVFSAASAGLPPGVMTDAVAVSSAGGLLLSFDTAVSLPGGLHVADEDLVRWNGSAFSLALDGSGAGMSPAYDVDAVDDLGPSHFLLSFETGGQVGSVVFADEDVIRYSSGVWSLVRDGSAADADWGPADLDAMQMVPEPRGAAPILAAIGLLVLAAYRRGGRPRGLGARPSAAALVAPSAIAFSILAGAPASALDGVIEINQTCAVSGGCFPGDTAGFPVTISTSGSYRLAGNLTIVDSFSGAIRVTASQVTIDLNGFAIIGPSVCSGTPLSCTPPTGSGIGIEGTGATESLRVMNGTVRGMGSDGVRLAARSAVESLRTFSNRGYGIYVGPSSIVSGNIASENGSGGISIGIGSIARGNAVTRNGFYGITDNCVSQSSSGFVVSDNTVLANDSYGIYIDCEASSVVRNTVDEHGLDGIYVAVGSNLSANVVVGNDRYGINHVPVGESSYTDNVVTGSGVANIGSASLKNLGGNSCGGTASCP